MNKKITEKGITTMGKDSEYYKKKKYSQKEKLQELMFDLPDFARKYINDKRLRTQTSTLVAYCYDILMFYRYLIASNPVFKNYSTKDFTYDDMKQLNADDVTEYQLYLEFNAKGEKHENGKKSIARKMAPLRGMFQYHYEHGNIESNPMTLVKLPQIKKDKNIIRLNSEEIKDILNCVEFIGGNTSEHMSAYRKRTVNRDLAIMTLLLGTGMRVSECAGLDLEDVNFTENSLVIVRKGGGQDVIYFGDEVAVALKDYIDGERAVIVPKEGHEKALFYSLQSKRMSVDAIENLVKKFGKIAVPNKKITPHKLRSTYGTALYRQTGDIRLVADVLGHENVNTTVTYYAAIEDEHKRSAAGAVKMRPDVNDEK